MRRWTKIPYNSVADLPEHIQKYSEKVKSQWLHVFNSTYDKVLKETGSQKDAEKRAFMSANSVLKTRFSKKNGMEKNSRDDYMSQLVDVWLGNLKG